MAQTDWGMPRPRHQYVYHPRPFPGQKGVLTYNGPLNMTAAAQGYGGYGYGAGYGYPGYTAYGTHGAYGAYGPAYGGTTSIYRRVSSGPVAPAVIPATYVGTTATTAAPVKQYAYVQAAATPTKLPAVYQTANYTTRLVTVPTSPTPTAEDIQLENRRVATERGAYEPRKIKPADAKPEDVFWCRERDGEWHCRPYYQIENECQPGRWQMDAEHGFLVFHRE